MWTRDAQGAAVLGGVRLDAIFAEPGPGVATPAYVYDLDGMVASARALLAAFGSAPHLVAYAVKACSAGPVVRALVEAGCGAEVVSGGELAVALACGASPDRILFSGVAKRDSEIDLALSTGERGILALQLESVEEVARVEARARAAGRKARVALRLNPGVEADTHAHVATGHDEAKFGIDRADVPDAFAALAMAPHLELVGLSCHLGSQLTRTGEYLASAAVVLEVAAAREAAHGPLAFVDLGGGFGVDYGSGCPAEPADFARAAVGLVGSSPLAGRLLVVEPGRSLVAAHGVLCASVIMAKRSRSGRRWLMIDAGMNDLVRPALYGAKHRVESMTQAPAADPGLTPWRVVGPVCESSDDFGEHDLPREPPTRVVLRDAGAYGFTMASEYNGRALPAEVFLRGGEVVAVSRARGVGAWVEERLRADYSPAAKCTIE